VSRPGGGKGSLFWGASPSTYLLIGKSRDLLPTGRDRTANLLAPYKSNPTIHSSSGSGSKCAKFQICGKRKAKQEVSDACLY